jgi:hypothetical protein
MARSINPNVKTNWAILARALRAISSCQTIEQLINAVTYAQLAHRHHCNARHSREFTNDITLSSKETSVQIRRAGFHVVTETE